MRYCILLLICVLHLSCKDDRPKRVKNDNQFTLLRSSEIGVSFTNKVIESPTRHLGHYDYFYNGSGVGIIDVNNDGLQDVFFAGNDTHNKLYLNKGNFKFEDISKEAGIQLDQWSTGVNILDINDDGYQDIYLCNSGPYEEDVKLANKLFINNGDNTFKESANEYGIDDPSYYSTHSIFFDFDNDEDLDLMVVNHSHIRYGKSIQIWEETINSKTPEMYAKSCNTMYENLGNGKYKDVTKEAGVFQPGFGLGAAATDFNEDGLIDIYITNDYFMPDFLYINNGDKTFTDKIKENFMHTSFYSMGCDAADFNNDGLIDLAVVDMTPADHFRNKTLMESMDVEKFDFLKNDKKYIPQFMYNSLSLNQGKGTFSEISHFAKMAQTDWSWAVLFADMNNNGWKDILITNGYKRDTKNQDWGERLDKRFEVEGATQEGYYKELMKANSHPVANYIYENNKTLGFKNVSRKWGVTDGSFSQGAAYSDLDNDGDLDLIISNLDQEAFIYENNSNQSDNNFIRFTLSNGKNTSSVINSKITLYHGENKQTVEYNFSRGFMSTMENIAHFGLGDQKIDRVTIEWPDGEVSELSKFKVNRTNHVDRKKQNPVITSKEAVKTLFLEKSSSPEKIKFVHKENDFNDFEKEILLPHKQSTLGPCVAVGDINGDGMDDFYIGGAKDQSGKFYLQQKDKSWVEKKDLSLSRDGKYEDVGGLFFDCDGDQDLDLYIASGGGGEMAGTPKLLQDRLYLNNGKGEFKRSNKLPRINSSTKSITSLDWDNDGDLDLFVGGRTLPSKYPLNPKSYLLENVNGSFKDVTHTIGKELQEIGMITSAISSDINNDGNEDLIVVGEWMSILVFINEAGIFQNKSATVGLPKINGWWQSIKKADFDNDGDDDFIVGNIGSNNKFHPSESKPLHVFANDFDKNGSLDIVLSKDYKGELFPVRGKECSTEQMPFLKDKFPLYSDFAASSINEILGEENISEATHLQATEFKHVYIENLGNGQLEHKMLNIESQISPILDFIIYDFDADGNLDVICGGNIYNTEVETPSYDSGKGMYLKGNGDGTFDPILRSDISGLSMPLNVKSIKLAKSNLDNSLQIVVGNNNSALQIFEYNKG